MTSVFNALAVFLRSLNDYITFDYLLYGTIALMALLIITSFLRSKGSYEVKLLRSVNKLNKYLAEKKYINDDNLIYFNNLMKKVPNTLRYCWQEYVLNRDKAPSDYMSVTTCIDQPIKTSSYHNTTKVCGIFTNIIAGLTLIIGMASLANANSADVIYCIFQGTLIPLLVLVIGNLFLAFLNSRRTAIVSDLYFSYHEFERNMNKACTTLPEFIDYEVLFTSKEIKQGIPVLQEYLDKMELAKQKQLEEEELSKFQYEDYDFEKLGVENSLLLDRAMNESEKYINVKRNLTDRVKAKEQEKYNHQKSFEEVTKDFERKSQACKESLAQISEQINNTTSKIDANYLRKRVNDEQQKLQLLEKDYDMAKSHFDKDQKAFQDEIDKYNSDISKRKVSAEEAMVAECRTYVNKIYAKVTETVISQTEPYMKQLEDTKLDLEAKVKELDQELITKGDYLNEMQSQLEEMEKQFNIKAAEIEALKSVKEYFGSEEFLKRVSMSQKELMRYIETGKSETFDRPAEYNGALAYEDLTNVVPAEVVRSENQNIDSAVQDEISNSQQELVILQEQKKQLETETAELENQKDELLKEKDALMEQTQTLEQQMSAMEQAKQAIEQEKKELEEEKARLEQERIALEENAKKIEESAKVSELAEAQEVVETNEENADVVEVTEGQQAKLLNRSQIERFENLVKPRISQKGVYKLKAKPVARKKSDPLKNSLSKLMSTVEKSKNSDRPKKKTVTNKAKVNTKKKSK